jgi:hypothetical protein
MKTNNCCIFAIVAIFFIILQTAVCKPFSRFNFAEIENELQNFHQNPFEAEQALGGNEEISEKDLELLGLIGKELKEMRRSIPEQFFNTQHHSSPDASESDYKIDNM